MPTLVRKLAVYASVDGVVLHPTVPQLHQPISSLQIQYSTHKITSLGFLSTPDVHSFTLLDAHGIVGFLNFASACYLVIISRREPVAQIKGAVVYLVGKVALIPLSSQTAAEKAIVQATGPLYPEDQSYSESDTSGPSDLKSDDDTASVRNIQVLPLALAPSMVPAASASSISLERSTNFAQNVIGRKGQYGRFAERWVSEKGWSKERRRDLGMSTDDDATARSLAVRGTEPANLPRLNASAEISDGPSVPLGGSKDSARDLTRMDSVDSRVAQHISNKLLPKLLQTTRLLFGSRNFYFSYDYDITRRFGGMKAAKAEATLCQNVDPLFFWNLHLSKLLVDGGHYQFVLPLMQGYVGQRTFSLESGNLFSKDSDPPPHGQDQAARAVEPDQKTQNSRSFLISIISRRSVMRPGLRYLRRGIDEQGHTANSVETEQILSRVSWASTDRVYSFTQFRGSIPLFFSQSPYSFKPTPAMQRSYETNHAAFRRHFKDLRVRYGGIHVVSLVDKTGGERTVGERYEEHAQKLNDEAVSLGLKFGFEWFDFHAKCRGFDFANVGLLVASLMEVQEEFGFTIETGGVVQRKQSGVLRTNCMDCLDRTNVVQSAFGQAALQIQLKAEGVEVDLQTDSTTQWFNTLWADHGDNISRQYASTAALKGDYTRTRKRNYRGAINDFGLTLSRYFNNIVKDYFSQAAIDYLLGNVTSQVFDEFEADMISGDPAMSMWKVRANAIDTSSNIVIPDQENLLKGWTLLSPRHENTIRTFPFEEVVLLLTNAALYAVRFDWSTEKVLSFRRVHLQSITDILRGAYITSTLAAGQMAEDKNVGFVVKYCPDREEIARKNTRSLNNSSADENDEVKPEFVESDASEQSATPMKNNLEGVLSFFSGGKEAAASKIKFLAFKALPARLILANADSQTRDEMSEKELIKCICGEIEKAAVIGNGNKDDISSNETVSSLIEKQDIISLDAAKRSTGLIEVWGHSLKKLVWA